MKRLILSSIFCLAFALTAHAQEKPQIQLIPPQKLQEFPILVNPSSGKPAYGLDFWKKGNMPPSSIELTLKLNPPLGGVCSVPLLEAHVEAVDPGMAFSPRSTVVPIPQARVPAPACQKK